MSDDVCAHFDSVDIDKCVRVGLDNTPGDDPCASIPRFHSEEHQTECGLHVQQQQVQSKSQTGSNNGRIWPRTENANEGNKSRGNGAESKWRC